MAGPVRTREHQQHSQRAESQFPVPITPHPPHLSQNFGSEGEAASVDGRSGAGGCRHRSQRFCPGAQPASAEFTFFGPGSVRRNSFPLTAPGPALPAAAAAPPLFSNANSRCPHEGAQSLFLRAGEEPGPEPSAGFAMLRAQSKPQCFPQSLLMDVVLSPPPKIQDFCQLFAPL